VYEATLSRRLTIGLLVDDGVVRPHPAVERVVRMAAELLKANGHDVVEWSSSLHPECIELMDMYYTADGGEDIRRDVEAGGEPFIPHVEKLISRGKAISVYDYWQLNKRRTALQQAYLEKWNNAISPTTGRRVDVVLMPVMPHPAVPHKGCRWVGYTKIWNFLDYTALVLPGGKVEAGDCDVAWQHEPRNVMDEWNAEIWSDNKADMADMGLPVGIQIAGRKLEEEKVLAVGKVLDGLLASVRTQSK
jgi:amidase